MFNKCVHRIVILFNLYRTRSASNCVCVCLCVHWLDREEEKYKNNITQAFQSVNLIISIISCVSFLDATTTTTTTMTTSNSHKFLKFFFVCLCESFHYFLCEDDHEVSINLWLRRERERHKFDISFWHIFEGVEALFLSRNISK